MQLTIYLDDDLAAKVNERLPRYVKVSVLGRWLLKGLVMTPQELAEECRKDEEEALIYGPYLQESVRKFFDATQVEKDKAAK